MKAENIFIEHLNSKVNYAIGDLDISKIVTAESKAKTVIGTSVYMAPEVWTSDNQQIYSSKVDSKFIF